MESDPGEVDRSRLESSSFFSSSSSSSKAFEDEDDEDDFLKPDRSSLRRSGAASGSQEIVDEPGDVPDELLDGVELVHLTGITTALGLTLNFNDAAP